MLYRISTCSLSRSTWDVMCVYTPGTNLQPSWIWHIGGRGGWRTLPPRDPSSPCMCGSIILRLLESDPSSSPFTSSKTLQWFPSNSCKLCSHFHCMPLLPSYASLDTAFDCRPDSWWSVWDSMLVIIILIQMEVNGRIPRSMFDEKIIHKIICVSLFMHFYGSTNL